MTSTEEAFLALSIAEDELQHAKDTRRIGIFTAAVSMSYYAAFYAAKAVIAYHREGPKTHQGTNRSFHRLAVRGSDFPSTIASFLGELERLRLKADYDMVTKGEWRDDDAAAAIAKAEAFIGEVQNWFSRHVS